MARASAPGYLVLAVVSGLIAGLLTGAWHYFATEPIIQRAIDLEAARPGTSSGVEAVTRSVQRLGLFIGFALYGVAWGAFFGLAAGILLRPAPHSRPALQAFGLALAGCWLLGVFPLLKYPANPPGIGDSETVGYRQGLYIGFLALSLLGGILTAFVYHGLESLGGIWRRAAYRNTASALLYGGYAVALALGMPEQPEADSTFAWMSTFHWLSLGGVLIFWGVLGSAFVFLINRQSPKHIV